MLTTEKGRGNNIGNKNGSNVFFRFLDRFGMHIYSTFIVVILFEVWRLSDMHFIDAEDGIGYWLGIVGGIILLLLGLYPLRKYYKAFRFMGALQKVFRVHIVFGLMGPALILIHSNFELGATNSNVALFAMLLVTFSGIIGRYFYYQINNRITGKRVTAEELQRETERTLKQLNEKLQYLPDLEESLKRYSEEASKAGSNMFSIIQLPLLHISCYFINLSLWNKCKASINMSSAEPDEKKYLLQSVRINLNSYFYAVRQLSELEFYQKLFSLWHVLHLPLFILLIITGIFHVIAVHLY